MEEVKNLSNSDLLNEFILVREHLINLKFELFKCGRDKFTEEMLTIENKNFKNLYEEIMRRMKKWNYQETLRTPLVSM